MAEPLERLVGFGRALRAAGLPVGTGRIESFCRAAALVEAADLYWAGRATLVAGPDGIELYDRVFRASFEDQPVQPTRVLFMAMSSIQTVKPPSPAW